MSRESLRPLLVQLGLGLVTAAALAWLLFAAAPAPGHAARPPLPRPVVLDVINEPPPRPATSPPPTSSAAVPIHAEGVKPW
jgi:hypothetical protein